MTSREKWLKDLNAGLSGEAAVAKFLEDKGYKVERIIPDVENIHKNIYGEYLPADLRILSHSSGGNKWLVGKTIDIKSDSKSHETGNHCLELLSNVGSGRPGWTYTTTADYIGFLSTGSGDLCIISTEEIRRKLAEIWHCFRKSSVPDDYLTSLVLLVPVDEMKGVSKWNGKIW